MTSEKVKVLYIAGTMRSGSTLLGRLLAEMPQTVDVGELGHLFSPTFRERNRCGCLREVGDCDFWQAVLERAFGGMERLDVAALHETKQAYRFRTLPRLLWERRAPPEPGRLHEYIQTLDALYRAVQEVSGARVIVDASKDPVYAWLLMQVPAIDLRVVHLVRDSRAVAYSQQRVKADPPLFSNPSRLPRVKPARTALVWNAVNALLTFHAISLPALRLRYEDFAADPEASLRRLWTLIDEAPTSLDFLECSPLRLHTSHTLAGNPDRFQTAITIRPDVEWRRKMSRRDRWVVTALTFPGLLYYGFLHSSPPEETRQPIRPSRVL